MNVAVRICRWLTATSLGLNPWLHVDPGYTLEQMLFKSYFSILQYTKVKIKLFTVVLGRGLPLSCLFQLVSVNPRFACTYYNTLALQLKSLGATIQVCYPLKKFDALENIGPPNSRVYKILYQSRTWARSLINDGLFDTCEDLITAMRKYPTWQSLNKCTFIN